MNSNYYFSLKFFLFNFITSSIIYSPNELSIILQYDWPDVKFSVEKKRSCTRRRGFYAILIGQKISFVEKFGFKIFCMWFELEWRLSIIIKIHKVGLKYNYGFRFTFKWESICIVLQNHVIVTKVELLVFFHSKLFRCSVNDRMPLYLYWTIL